MIRFVVTVIGLLALPLLMGCGRLGNGDAAVETAIRLYEQRKFAEALPHLEQALDKPLRKFTRSEVLTTIGNCYNELEQFDESLKYHDRAIEADPQNHQAYVNKGIVYRLTGEYDRAAEMYAQALKLAPDYAELHASMGALAIYQNDFQSAVNHLERAVQLDDTLPVAHSNLALAYATVGRFEDADQQLKKAVIRGYHQPELIKERIEQFRSAFEQEK